MRTTFKILNCPAGGSSVGSASLRYRNLLKVKHEGRGYDIVYGVIPTPGVRQVQYIGAFGILRFSPDISFQAGANVYAYYEI